MRSAVDMGRVAAGEGHGNVPAATHGTLTAYAVHGCRCDECRRVHREAERARQKRAMLGTSLFVPAEPVRQRVLWLMQHGMSHDEIARAAGLNDARLSDLMTGHWRTGKPLTRMKRENAEAIMSVRQRKPLRGTYVKAPDSEELVLDLMAMGYSGAWIARSIGLSYQGLAALTRAGHTAQTYAALKRLHETTTEPNRPTSHHQRAAAARSRNYAHRARPRKYRQAVAS